MWYFCGCAFYTIAVFVNAYIDDDSTLLSDADTRSKGKLLAVHLGYLCVLCLVVQAAVSLRSHLSKSMLLQNGRGGSWADLLFVAALITVYFIEEDWLAAAKKRSHKRA